MAKSLRPHNAFTCRTNPGGRALSIQSDCSVCAAFYPGRIGTVAPPAHPFKAIWDTGATGSVITQNVIDTCGLVSTGMTKAFSVEGEHDAEVYLVNIVLPNKVQFLQLRVTRGKISPGIDVLIGMDIISLGDLSITNFEGNTVFSYRYPSVQEVDFVKDLQTPPKRRKSGFAGSPRLKGRRRR